MNWRKNLNSDIHNSVAEIKKFICENMSKVSYESNINSELESKNIIDISWKSVLFRKAHLNFIDMQEERGVSLLHFCIYPHFHNNGPIFGLDIVAGKRKISGFFHDYSYTSHKEHDMIKVFYDISKDYSWNKKRELPEWARSIFSNHIIAIGNITNDTEIEQILSLVKRSFTVYIDSIANYNNIHDIDYGIQSQNRYCLYQKQNPQLYKSLKALGFEDHFITDFVENILFKEE